MEDSWNSDEEREFIRLEAKRRARAARTAATVSVCKSKNQEEDEVEKDKSQDVSYSFTSDHGSLSHVDFTESYDEPEPEHKKMSLFDKALLTNKAVKMEFQDLKVDSANKVINDEQAHIDLAKIHAPFLLFIRWLF